MKNKVQVLKGYWMKGLGYYEDCSEILFVLDSKTPHKKLHIGSVIIMDDETGYEVVSAEVVLVNEEQLVKQEIGGYSPTSQTRGKDDFGFSVLRPIINLYVKDIKPSTINWKTMKEQKLEPIQYRPTPTLATRKDSLTFAEALDYIMTTKKVRDKIRDQLGFKRLSKQRATTFMHANMGEVSRIIGFTIIEEEEILNESTK